MAKIEQLWLHFYYHHYHFVIFLLPFFSILCLVIFSSVLFKHCIFSFAGNNMYMPGDCNILWHKFMIYNAMEKTFYNLFSLRQPKEIHVPWKNFKQRRYKDCFPYSSIHSKSNTIFESLVSILSWNNSASNDLDKNYSTDT